MAYYMYLDGVLLPVTPSKIDMKIKGQNKTMTLINEAQINILKTPGLTDISFKAMLPAFKYPFAEYGGEFVEPKYYLKKLEELQTAKKPFQFIVTRNSPVGKSFFHTNMSVSLESYDISEDVKEGFDIYVNIKLKQYKSYGAKTVVVTQTTTTATTTTATATTYTPRPAENPPATGTSYTVKAGDCLWNIAKQFYGNGAMYMTIYNANKGIIGDDPNLIKPGQVLYIPNATSSGGGSSGGGTPSGNSPSGNKPTPTSINNPDVVTPSPPQKGDSSSNGSAGSMINVKLYVQGSENRIGTVKVSYVFNGKNLSSKITTAGYTPIAASGGTVVKIEPLVKSGVKTPFGITVDGRTQVGGTVSATKDCTVTVDFGSSGSSDDHGGKGGKF